MIAARLVHEDLCVLVFDRLRGDRRFGRLNWTVLDDPALFQPESAREAVPDEVDHRFFCVERQTIRRLVTAQAIVFPIRSYACAITELARQSGFFEHLRAGIDGVPPAMPEHKGWVGVARRVRDVVG